MTEQPITTKVDLLAEIERTWPVLNTALDRLTPPQLTITDAQGWTVKDHVVHIAAWERSVVFLLQGQPRHEGLGVAEALYEQDDVDAINAAIQQQHAELSFAGALEQLRSVHGQIMALLDTLSDADLQQPYRHYLPDEPGEGEGPPVINVIYGNTADHFREHQEWIDALVK
jgi:hypothetical protein